MSQVNGTIEEFCLHHSSETDDVLKTVYRDTWVNVMYPQMLTNELQGNLLAALAVAKRPMRILEIGTFTGYSAICMARGLAEGGSLITLEKNAELETRIRKNLNLAKLSDRVELIIGDAKTILQSERFNSMTTNFDMVYIDADKENYPLYLQKAYAMLNADGLLLADNILWGGKMLNENAKPDKEINGLRLFLEQAAQLSWSHRMILPVGDGLFMGVK